MDPKTALEQAKAMGMDSLAEKCKTDLFFLCKNILAQDPSLVTEGVHKPLSDYTKPLLPGFEPDKMTDIPDDFDPNKNKLLLLMPRGTFKSSIVTIGFAIQNLLNDPNIRILIDSETYAKSKAFLAEIKGHLEQNPKLRKIFYHIYGCYPDDNKRNDVWSDAQINLASRKIRKKEANISCAGIDVTKNGMHYDLIIADDLHSEKNVTNKEQIEQVIEHYKLAFSLLDPKKPMIVIGTRWDYSDLYQHIIDNESSRYNIMVKQAINDDGSLLFPERLDHDFLDDVRKTQGSYIFSCQYMNNPVDNETATFKRSYFRKKEWDLVKDKPINWFCAVDPSFEGEYSDYAAFVLAGMDHEQNIYVRKIHRAKMTYSDIINLMFDWHARYNPRRWALETVATQKNIQYILNSEQKRRGVWLPVEEIKQRTKTKEERIRALAPYYEFGRLYHIKECPNLEEMEYELIHFPRGKHDDVIDALSTVLEIATPPSHSLARRQERRKQNKLSALAKPRSPITGV